MASIDYKLYQVNPVGLEQISEFDLKTIEKFSVNTNFTPFEDKVELHVYGTDNVILESIYDHRNFKFLQGSETIGLEGASEVSLDPIQDSIDLNYELGGVKLVYNFLDNLYSENQAGGEFFIEEISEDRTELRLLTNQITEEDIEDYTEAIVEDLNSSSFFDDFRLNVKGNDLLIGINIKIQDFRGYKSVVVKLYEALPVKYQLKQLLTVDRIVSDSIGYEVDTTVTPDIIKPPTLKGPNFSIGEPDSVSYPTSFLNSDELFSFPTNNTYRQVNSLFKEKGIELSFDYSDYGNFIQFSSAEERLRNFQYKLNLIESYQLNIDSSSLASSFANTSGSTKYWTDKLNGIIQNFDHYDRHLYFNSSSTSWPKLTPYTKPYVNATTGSITGSFMTNMLLSASNYDTTNYSSLINTVPEYLREDPDSVKYSTFTHMLGQHFDNIWVYTKALSDKYDNDNRADYGISKDLVQETLKNFGVKIYNSFQSTEDLFNTFTGKLYSSGSTAFEQSGSNIIASLVSASNNGSYSVSGSQGLINSDSIEDYKRDIHKRIYHNLPYLLKTKGTERGLKALIASFGVPTENNIAHITGSDKQNITGLKVRMVGGADRNDSPYFGPSVNITSSIDRIRIDNTGSIITGSTLSRYSSIMSRDYQYTDDIHTIEVGFSPTYELDKKIINDSTTGFNIDNFIGDPGQAYSSSYEQLVSQSIDTLAPSFDINLSRNKSEFGYQQILNTPNINVATGSIPSVVPTTPGYVYSPTWAQEYVVTDGVVNIGSGSTIILDPNGVSIDVGDELVGDHSATDITIWYATVTEVVDSTTIKANIHVQIPDGTTLTRLEGSVPLKGRYLLGQNNNLVKVTATTGANVLSVYTEEPINTLYGVGGQYAASPTIKYTYSYFFESMSHSYGELVRYLKYYDNVLFKMIKDFVPARSNIDTGLIIKPHLLERNKIKQVEGSFSTSSYLSEINTAFSSASDGSAFTNKAHDELTIPLTASYSQSIITAHPSGGLVPYFYHEKERTRYDGEFSGSNFDIYKHSLNDDNDWKYDNPGGVQYRGKKYCYYVIPPSPSNTPSNTPSISNTPTPTPTISVTPSITPTPSAALHVQRFEMSTGSVAYNGVCDSGGGDSGVCSVGWDSSNISVRWFYKPAGSLRLYPEPGDIIYRASSTSGDSEHSNVTGALTLPEFSGKVGHITSGLYLNSNGQQFENGGGSLSSYTYQVLETTSGGELQQWHDCGDC